MTAVLLAGGDDQRRLGDVGIDEVAHSMTQAASGMKIQECWTPCRLCVAIGHGNRRGFLECQHIVNVRRSQ
ncbi:hypothetical protein BJP62_07080 [Jeongeupia sp. USM3]|nr:hypothetical protein BJP62_07080 [Jeongeupia sp. USM3]